MLECSIPPCFTELLCTQNVRAYILGSSRSSYATSLFFFLLVQNPFAKFALQIEAMRLTGWTPDSSSASALLQERNAANWLPLPGTYLRRYPPPNWHSKTRAIEEEKNFYRVFLSLFPLFLLSSFRIDVQKARFLN